MTSSRKCYEVVSDLIRDVCEAFDYVGPATTAGLTFVPNSDDPKVDIRGKFIYEKGVLVLQMSGGGFTITIR